MSDTTSSFRGTGILIVAALVVIAAGMKAAQDLMVPFLLSTFIATIAATPMFWLQSRGLPSSFALPAVILTMIVVVVLFGALLAQSASAFSAKLPFYTERLETLQNDFITFVQPILAPLGFEIDVRTIVSNFSPNSALEMAGTTLARLGGVLSNSLLIVLTVIFILAEAASFPRKLSDVLSDPERDLPHFARFAENVNRYIAIKTSVSMATGLTVTLLLWFLGVDFPILWGMLAFLLNYVPTIGSIIAAVPPVLLALVQVGPTAAGIAGIGMIFINMFFGNAVEPRYLGKGLGLSTLVVFLSLVLWGWILGPVGMLLSVPLTITAKIALEANPDTEWLAHLLGPADELEEDAEEETTLLASAEQASTEATAEQDEPKPKDETLT